MLNDFPVGSNRRYTDHTIPTPLLSFRGGAAASSCPPESGSPVSSLRSRNRRLATIPRLGPFPNPLPHNLSLTA